MTPLDILERLAAEGFTATLKLRLDGDSEPSPELDALLRQHRDDLITYLARQIGDTPQMCRLSEEKRAGASWCRLCWRYHLQACVPTEKRFEEVN